MAVGFLSCFYGCLCNLMLCCFAVLDLAGVLGAVLLFYILGK